VNCNPLASLTGKINVRPGADAAGAVAFTLAASIRSAVWVLTEIAGGHGVPGVRGMDYWRRILYVDGGMALASRDLTC
jgi:hypothetical protein